MTNKTILIVDDEPDILELLEVTILRMGLDVLKADSVATAMTHLNSSEPVHLCLTDVRLPDGSGIDIVKSIQQNHPATAVAVITAYGSTELAIEALKSGAFDFINKPLSVEQLRNVVRSALRLDTAPGRVDSSQNTRLLGESSSIKNLRAQIQKLARSQAPVYISGESGSGKEVVARLIHANGPRADAPFVPVNCGAIPSELVESEFFGHVKGSFTGAIDHKEGLFEAANGGTLFLDEVADLPLAMQVKLLRAIQEKAIRRIGSNKEIPVDVRLLSATHRDLSEAVAKGHFRNDLFYRINVIEVKVPALRERASDIPLLAEFILGKIAKEWNIPTPGIDEQASLALQHYPFPGNVRELENIIERAATLCEQNVIREADLSLPDAPALEQSSSRAPSAGQSLLPAVCGDIEGYLGELEQQIIQEALELNRWNKTESAKSLGLTFRQFRYKLKKYNIED
ncbi:sigma-54-dependent Fis family transcriptional regulator [Spongiibacter sp. KMU-158]|uniref:Sigma-54-dependent Fis family transcriptional regulator n=1 Tax=Spongiibacter pelagi TaxID=2760804 RepID=A0A927GWI4_9GAMM|nr:sigma-54 dependent transcriptional regulator [Spongiibacter pelagi]MBD2859490.1 sigma-54-dependent Fis family transcriptional regulator [Spongiibacter pelagi]